MFGRQGYDETTVAEIAAAAEIGTRTFFTYFASKEDLLFPESDARARITLEAIADRRADEGPVDILLRALDTVAETDTDMVSPMARCGPACSVPFRRSGEGDASPDGHPAGDRASAQHRVP
ncbi:TetR family transcriptional regulator [Catenulispora yoronensis]